MLLQIIPQGLKSLRENWKLPNSVPQGRLSVAQDAVLGKCCVHEQSRKGRLKVRNFQSSLTGLNHVSRSTQDCVLGYTQPSLRDSVSQ